MSAILKEVQQSESTNLIDFLVINDQLPIDFYTNPVYDIQLDKAIELSTSLVYPLDDDGEKKAKTDATSINKFATMFDKFIATTFKQQTESVTLWRDGKKAKTKKLLENRQRLLDQFAEKRLEKLNSITDVLQKELMVRRIESGIKDEFCGCADLSPFVKLTGTMTDGGQLTKKAKDFIAAIVAGNLAEQNRIESRVLLLENRCLRADINPPLTQTHFGTVFYADDAIFHEKMEDLIETEIQRRAEMEARIIKQQEAQKQKEIDAAIKAREIEIKKNAEAHFKALGEKDRAENEKQSNKPTVQELRDSADRIDQSAQYADRNEDRKREMATANELRKQADDLEKAANPVTGKRTVQVTAIFKFENISERVSEQAVVDFFKKQLSEKLAAILDSARGDNV